jgi:hypothetical protein
MTDQLNTPGVEIPDELKGQIAITTLDRIYNWSRRNSLWPLMSGLACCAIEMICTAASRYDFSRFGMEVMRPSPQPVSLASTLPCRQDGRKRSVPNCCLYPVIIPNMGNIPTG